MRHYKKGLAAIITTAATAAVVMPAGPAIAGNQSASGVAAPSASCFQLCFDILNDNDVAVLKDVDVDVAANVCGVQVLQLTALGIGQIVYCSSSNPDYKKAKRTR